METVALILFWWDYCRSAWYIGYLLLSYVSGAAVFILNR